jgi:hypothetical protein
MSIQGARLIKYLFCPPESCKKIEFCRLRDNVRRIQTAQYNNLLCLSVKSQIFRSKQAEMTVEELLNQSVEDLNQSQDFNASNFGRNIDAFDAFLSDICPTSPAGIRAVNAASDIISDDDSDIIRDDEDDDDDSFFDHSDDEFATDRKVERQQQHTGALEQIFQKTSPQPLLVPKRPSRVSEERMKDESPKSEQSGQRERRSSKEEEKPEASKRTSSDGTLVRPSRDDISKTEHTRPRLRRNDLYSRAGSRRDLLDRSRSQRSMSMLDCEAGAASATKLKARREHEKEKGSRRRDELSSSRAGSRRDLLERSRSQMSMSMLDCEAGAASATKRKARREHEKEKGSRRRDELSSSQHGRLRSRGSNTDLSLSLHGRLRSRGSNADLSISEYGRRPRGSSIEAEGEPRRAHGSIDHEREHRGSLASSAGSLSHVPVPSKRGTKADDAKPMRRSRSSAEAAGMVKKDSWNRMEGIFPTKRTTSNESSKPVRRSTSSNDMKGMKSVRKQKPDIDDLLFKIKRESKRNLMVAQKNSNAKW